MKKLNLVELLKNCPIGMELDCTMYDKVTLVKVIYDEDVLYPIQLRRADGYKIYLTKYGQYTDAYFAKCIIFPKGKTTWEGFVPPQKFKDGDIITDVKDSNPFIFHCDNGEFYDVHCALLNGHLQIYKRSNDWVSNRREFRYATEEEKEKLFDVLEAKGYKWNPETKTLDKLIKPKFKVGDRIKQIGSPRYYIIKTIEFDRYVLNNNQFVRFIDEHIYELVPNKFDINTLIPFESKVLVRNINAGDWEPAFWGYYSKEYSYPYLVAGGNTYAQCIPYEGNEHLLGTTDDCDEYYNIWDK